MIQIETVAIIMPPTTSMTQCCFVVRVEIQIKIDHKRKSPDNFLADLYNPYEAKVEIETCNEGKQFESLSVK